MEVQELTKKVEELQERLSKLEKIEKRRKSTKFIKISIKIIIIIAIGIFIYKGYKYVDEHYLKPIDEIKEKIEIKDNIKEKTNGIYDKIFSNNNE